MAKDDCCANSESQPEQWSCVRWNQNNELKDAKVLWSWEGLQSADTSLWFAVGDYKRPLSHYTFTFTLIPLFTSLNSHKTYAEQSPKCFFFKIKLVNIKKKKNIQHTILQQNVNKVKCNEVTGGNRMFRAALFKLELTTVNREVLVATAAADWSIYPVKFWL